MLSLPLTSALTPVFSLLPPISRPTDTGLLSATQELLAMLTPFWLLIGYWWRFNKRCVRQRGVAVGVETQRDVWSTVSWTVSHVLISETRCQSKLQSKTVLTSPFNYHCNHTDVTKNAPQLFLRGTTGVHFHSFSVFLITSAQHL